KSIFNCGKFLFQLKRAAAYHLAPVPWHVRMSFELNAREEADKIAVHYLKALNLPNRWKSRILSSIQRVVSGKRFTAQFQIPLETYSFSLLVRIVATCTINHPRFLW
ncbi:Uncharacterized protein FKW44_015325, partial [Caligus rogercresseyi]